MDSALSELGWIQRVVVNRRTGRIIDGHLRADMARAAGDKVPVQYVDLYEDEERVALATLDPVTAPAEIRPDRRRHRRRVTPSTRPKVA